MRAKPRETGADASLRMAMGKRIGNFLTLEAAFPAR